jgi:hypothetical protein
VWGLGIGVGVGVGEVGAGLGWEREGDGRGRGRGRGWLWLVCGVSLGGLGGDVIIRVLIFSFGRVEFFGLQHCREVAESLALCLGEQILPGRVGGIVDGGFWSLGLGRGERSRLADVRAEVSSLGVFDGEGELSLRFEMLLKPRLADRLGPLWDRLRSL